MFRITHALRLCAVVIASAYLAACDTCAQTDQEINTVQPSIPQNVTGLEATVKQAGRDQAVGDGDIASMHYTGWLFDETAEGGRGTKFDSSKDRNQVFEFPLGEGRVIRGGIWALPGCRSVRCVS